MENNIICKKCGQIAGWDGHFQGWVCTNSNCGYIEKKKISNADHIRSLNDEELANFLINHIINALNSPAVYHGKISKEQMLSVEIKWLKNEYDSSL